LPVATSGDELAELGQAFNQLLDQLFEAYERQRRFSADAAHQLRTPLTVLQGQIDVALRRQRSAQEHEQTMSILREQVGDLNQIVESLLFLATPETEQMPLDMSELDVSAWTNDYLRRWETHARWRDLDLDAHAPAPASTSPVLLGQLLDNLIGNALKYSEPGSPVRIDVRCEAAEVVIDVVDHGIGISPDDLSCVFEPLFRGRQARQSGAAGAGLGLAIAARIAAVLGGRLDCVSTPGRGSRFSIHLPVRKQRLPEAAAARV
jgi:signal transduction histidine kinase